MKQIPVNHYYPAFLDLRGRHCIIIGAGEIAERKVQQLLGCEALITFISPEASTYINNLAQEKMVIWLKRNYQIGDLSDAFLAIAATEDTEVNQAVHSEAETRGILVNIVDVPHLCSFIAPAVIEKGPVKVAISTAGTSPALARKLRETIQASDLLAWSDAAKTLSEVRQELKETNSQASPETWQTAMDGEVLSLIQAGDYKNAKARLLSALRGEGDQI